MHPTKANRNNHVTAAKNEQPVKKSQKKNVAKWLQEAAVTRLKKTPPA